MRSFERAAQKHNPKQGDNESPKCDGRLGALAGETCQSEVHVISCDLHVTYMYVTHRSDQSRRSRSNSQRRQNDLKV